MVSVLVFNVLGLALVLWLARNGWPGEPSRCMKDFVCYCERTQSGLMRQPFNTWSNLGNVPLAAWLAWDAAGSGRRGLGLGFAFAASAQGLASMCFHGSLTTWGAMLDGVMIFLPVGLALAVSLLRLGALRERHLPVWLASCLAVALGYRLLVPIMAPLFLVAVVAIVASERRARQHDARRPDSRWFGRALTLLAGAAAVLALSLLPGFPLCSRFFPWGHALWHVLVTLALGATWLHARAALA